jgi:hypothetical protein
MQAGPEWRVASLETQAEMAAEPAPVALAEPAVAVAPVAVVAADLLWASPFSALLRVRKVPSKSRSAQQEWVVLVVTAGPAIKPPRVR